MNTIPPRLRFLLSALALGLSGRLAAAEPVTVQPLRPLQPWVEAEFRIDHAPVAANNYDSDQIALDAAITTPAGRVWHVPAFWCQDYKRTEHEGGEKPMPLGEPGWRLRFTPTESGLHRVALATTVAGRHTRALAQAEFTVGDERPAGRHGWVRVGPDRRYFETSDGRALRLIGENVCWPEKGGTADYDRWFKLLHDSGQNCARLWIAPWWAAIEQDADSLTRYRQDSAWQLDGVFAAAAKHGIYLILCLDFHGRFQAENPAWGGSGNYWPTHPYNVANGGPCATPNDFFTNPAAHALYEKRLRYLVARYGASPWLLSWQFFNEIDNVFEPRGLRAVDVAAWHGKMARWLKAHDPYGHLVTTSLTGGSDRELIWKIPEMDFAVYHSYDEAAPARGNAALAGDFHRRYGKPVVIGEYGVNAMSWARASDPHLHGLRQSLWGGALGGAAGTPLPWWWNEMDQDNVYPVFAALSSVLRRAGWEEGNWRPAAVSITAPVVPEAKTPAEYSGPLNPNRFLGGKLPGRAVLRGPLTAQRAFGSIESILRGPDPRYGSNAMEVAGCWGQEASLRVHIRSVMDAPDIVGLVDGREVTRLHIDNDKPALPYRVPVDKSFTVPILPGEHTIRLQIADRGWTVIDRCSIEGLVVSPDDTAGFLPEVIALRQDSRAVVYAVSPWMVYPAGAFREAGPAQQGHEVVLADWPKGRFKAEWFDPLTAKAVGSTGGLVSDGTLRLPVPVYSVDAAAIVTPE